MPEGERCPEGAEGESLMKSETSGKSKTLSSTAYRRSPPGPVPSVASRHLPALRGVTHPEGAFCYPKEVLCPISKKQPHAAIILIL